MAAATYTLTPEDKAFFDREGYLVVRGLMSDVELSVIRAAVEWPGGITRYAFENDDGEGKRSKMSLFNYPGDDVTGLVCRLRKVAGTMAGLLAPGGSPFARPAAAAAEGAGRAGAGAAVDGTDDPDAVFHYHTKLIMKEARTGGAFVMHQDFGYWRENLFLRPDMGTVMIAIDEATRENGALQVVPRSHRCGTVTHKLVGGQIGADLERVTSMLTPEGGYSLVHMSLAPGDAVFFHCNTLHKSDQNLSAKRRYAFLCSYSRVDNPGLVPHHCPHREGPVALVADDALVGADPFLPVDPAVKQFMVPLTYADDGSLPALTEKWKRRKEDGEGAPPEASGRRAEGGGVRADESGRD